MIFSIKKARSFALTGIFAVVVCSLCTAVNQTRTIGNGNFGLETSLGGPFMTNLGAPIPIPNLFLGARYGIRNDFDISANLNFLSPVTPGITLDLITAAHWLPIQPGIGFQDKNMSCGWSAGGSARIQWLSDFKSSLLLLPDLELIGAYRYKWLSLYTGVSTGFNFYRPDNNDPLIVFSPFSGIEFIPNKHLSFGIKCTAYDIFYNFKGSQMNWIYLVDKSSEWKRFAPLGVTIGFGYTFIKS
jgi:hypothetical protein